MKVPLFHKIAYNFQGVGHIAPHSICILVDVQLVNPQQCQLSDKTATNSLLILLLGGGRHPLIVCQIADETLLKLLEGPAVADISSASSSRTSSLMAYNKTLLSAQQRKEHSRI